MIENRPEVLAAYIKPFCPEKKRSFAWAPDGWLGFSKIQVSHGMSEAGYDITLGQDVTLYGGHAVLGVSAEHVAMPAELTARLIGKSTWARLGVHLNVTEIDPGFKGHITLEITYLPLWEGWLRHFVSLFWPRRLVIPKDTGIGCLQFCHVSSPRAYKGKYQDQPAAPVAAK